MIAVIGDLGRRGASSTAAANVAASAAAAGSRVQAVGVVAPDSSGDAVLLALARVGVEHAAILRKSGASLDRADLELALRYLPDTKVVVLVDVGDDLMQVAADGASWSGAWIVAVVPPANAADATGAAGGGASAGSGASVLPEDALVLEAPRSDPDATFAGFVGELAARLDRGEEPRAAWDAALRSKAVDALSPRGR
jgi:hypothetical protein